MMQICVCGWYFRPDFYKLMGNVTEKYPVDVIANNPNIPHATWNEKLRVDGRENIGLEWGAYDYFLKNVWDSKSDVLFLHDDVRVRPVMQNYEIIPNIKVFDRIAGFGKMGFDQVYIFKNMREAMDNYCIHGRAFYCSSRFLRYFRRYNGGFWYDENNTGHTLGPTPPHCLHYNEADYRFRDFMKAIPEKNRLNVSSYVILSALDCARRGRFEEEVAAQIPI